MFTREIIGQFFLHRRYRTGIVWLGVALAWAKIARLRHPPDISERTYAMVEAYVDSDKKTVKRAEIHDRLALAPNGSVARKSATAHADRASVDRERSLR